MSKSQEAQELRGRRHARTADHHASYSQESRSRSESELTTEARTYSAEAVYGDNERGACEAARHSTPRTEPRI